MTVSALPYALVAMPRWTWLPGMRWIAIRQPPMKPVVGRVADELRPTLSCRGRRTDIYPGALPDIDDDATAGALTRLLRCARPRDPVALAWHPGAMGWRCEVGDRHYYGTTAGRAVAAALVAP